MRTKKKKLLLIDDEENMLHMLSAYMKKQGYEIATASGGDEGVEQVDRFRPDLILCDLQMPGMDGLAFLVSMGEQLKDMPVIMMSAYATVDTAVQAMREGAYDFITKPFKMDEINCILQRAEEFITLKKENIQLKNRVQELQGEVSFASIICRSQ